MMRWLTLALVALAMFWQTGCAQQCAQMKQQYDKQILQESKLLEGASLGEGAPTHVGVALRYDLLGTLAQKLVGSSLRDGLKLKGAVPIGGGKTVSFDMAGEALDLAFEADSSCEGCFRLVGDLGGDVSVTLPLLGKRTVPLDGSMGLVAPLVMKQADDGTVKVTLDMSKIAEQSSTFLTVEAQQLPEAIGRALKQPLTQEVLKRLTAKLKPLELFSFRPPQLGIAGLKMLPSQIKLMPEQRAIFVGFTTNLPGVAAGAGLNAQKALAFSEGENVAVALQPELVVHIVSLLIQEGKIPRRYTMQGRASEAGPARVTMRGVRVDQGTGGEEPVKIGFRAWNLLSEGQAAGPCFWFDALVTGLIKLENQKLTVDLQQIELQDASVVPEIIGAIASWKQAEFLDETKKIIERTLTEPRIDLPVGQLVLAPSSLAKDNTTLALRSKVRIDFGGE